MAAGGGSGAGLRGWLPALLLAAALMSGAATAAGRLGLVRRWRSAPDRERHELVLAQDGPVIRKVLRTVPPDGRILLFSGLDPAVLPYYLHPRRIWQTGTDPETNARFMDLPPSPFRFRPPESFAVEWMLFYYPGNASDGGMLMAAEEFGGRGGAPP